MLEKVLLTLAAIIAVFLIVVALQLSEFQVERTATMAAPPAAVFDQVNDFHKWDPTELNRQGPDTGTQYRSAIFPTNAEQATVAKAYIDQLDQARVFDAAIVTKIEPGRSFYPAEGYHQDFLARNPR